MAGERFHRQAKPRNDRAAGKAALRIDSGDGRGGAHVDDDERRAVQMQRRDRADNKVCADLAGVVEPDVQPGFETLADNKRIQTRKEFDRPAQRGRERPHNAREDRAFKILRPKARKRKDLFYADGIFTVGLIHVRRHARYGVDLSVFDAAEDDVRVAGVDGKDHGVSFPFSRCE